MNSWMLSSVILWGASLLGSLKIQNMYASGSDIMSSEKA